MLQKLYTETLAKVYENVRGVYIDLMKCIKPNAFLEIQGISTDMENTDNYSNLTEVPQVLKLDDLLELVERNQLFLNTSNANSAQSN